VVLRFGTCPPSPSLLHKPRRHFDIHDRVQHGYPHGPHLIYAWPLGLRQLHFDGKRVYLSVSFLYCAIAFLFCCIFLFTTKSPTGQGRAEQGVPTCIDRVQLSSIKFVQSTNQSTNQSMDSDHLCDDARQTRAWHGWHHGLKQDQYLGNNNNNNSTGKILFMSVIFWERAFFCTD
jgi:hypothetical protein